MNWIKKGGLIAAGLLGAICVYLYLGVKKVNMVFDSVKIESFSTNPIFTVGLLVANPFFFSVPVFLDELSVFSKDKKIVTLPQSTVVRLQPEKMNSVTINAVVSESGAPHDFLLKALEGLDHLFLRGQVTVFGMKITINEKLNIK